MSSIVMHVQDRRLTVWDEIVGDNDDPDLHIRLTAGLACELPISEIRERLPENLVLTRGEYSNTCDLRPKNPGSMNRQQLYCAFLELYNKHYFFKWVLRHDY